MRSVILAVVILVCTLRASAADVIRVTVSCPGADARTLDDTVLTPLFRQINGVEGLTRIETEARNDGSGMLLVYFQSKADLNLAEMRVQNRVNLALPAIPETCRNRGVSVQKVPAGPPQFWLALTSADSSYDEEFLRKYAMVNVKTYCAHVPGVTEVRVIGIKDFGMQIWLNPEKLAAYKLTDRDVIESLRQQNLPIGAGGVISSKQSHHVVVASAGLRKPEDFESVTLRTSAEGDVIRLKDVARVEMGAPSGGFTSVDGMPAALIEVTAWPGRVTVDQLVNRDLIDNLPPGMKLVCLADRSADHLLAVDVRLPSGVTLERTKDIAAQATDLILKLPGKPSVFAFGESREADSATLFVKTSGKGEPTAQDVDKALAGISDTIIRTCDVPPREAAFPIRMAVVDPNELFDSGEGGGERFQEAVNRVLEALAKDQNVTGPAAAAMLPTPQYTIDVDRDKCAQLGVELKDLFTALQTSLGGIHATEFSRFGNMHGVTVQVDPQFAQFPTDLDKMNVRVTGGEMVSLSNLLTVRKIMGSSSVVRIDGYRAIVITAAPLSGKSSAHVAAHCVKLANEVLPRGYRAINFTSP